MALQIRTTQAVLGHRTINARQSIQQPKAQVEGFISHAQVRVEATLPKVTINQTQAFNESGLKTIDAFSADYVAYAKQKMQESIARISEQGDQLANVHEGGEQIADQALYNAFDQFYNEFGMVTMPRSRPQIDVIEGTVDIEIKQGEITGTIRAQKPVVEYQPGKVEKYMEQYDSILIRYIENRVNLQV